MSVFRKLNTLETHGLIKRTYGCQASKDGGRDRYGIWDGHAHTAICERDDQQGPSVEHRELCSALHGSLEGREVAGSRYTCMYGWGPLLFTCNGHNIILTGYTPILNKNFNRKEIKYSWTCYCHNRHPVLTTLVHSEHVRQGLNSQSDGPIVSSSPPCGGGERSSPLGFLQVWQLSESVSDKGPRLKACNCPTNKLPSGDTMAVGEVLSY